MKFTHEIAFSWFKFTSWTLYNYIQDHKNWKKNLKNHKLLANRQQEGVYSIPYRYKDKAEYNVASAKYLFA